MVEMLRPIRFPGVNTVLRAPKDWDATTGECGDLPVMRGDGACVSVWSPSWLDRLRLLAGWNIVLHVLTGDTQPPVSLSVQDVPEVD